MSKFTINPKNFNRFSKRLEKLFEEKTNGQKLGHLESQEFMSKIFGCQDLHEFKKFMKIQENNSNLNDKAFDPFDSDTTNQTMSKISEIGIEHIVEPLKSKVSALDNNPYKKYNYLNEVWHNISHGININNKEELTSFFNDIEKSRTMWKESSVYLGLILQAVEKDTIIDTGYPIGLVPQPDGPRKENDKHITTEEIKVFIEAYKKYLIEEVVENLNNVNVEIKPYYALTDQEYDNEFKKLVENNWNKRLRIK